MTGNPGRAGLRNVSASVYAKLRNHARAKGLDTQTVLARYVQERLLHRLSVSEEAENFCLKGGLLIAAYNNGDLLRPTEDIDFNGFDEDGSVARIKDAMRCVLATDVEDDGVIFDISSMRVVKSRDDGVIPGGKVLVHAVVHTARVDLKIDVGFGNVITPGVSPVEFPSLLDGTAPRPLIKAYPLETTIAEKLHAMAQFGYENTRLKDHFDILILSRIRRFDGAVLAQAIERTFERQGRPIPETLEGLSRDLCRGAFIRLEPVHPARGPRLRHELFGCDPRDPRTRRSRDGGGARRRRTTGSLGAGSWMAGPDLRSVALIWPLVRSVLRRGRVVHCLPALG